MVMAAAKTIFTARLVFFIAGQSVFIPDLDDAQRLRLFQFATGLSPAIKRSVFLETLPVTEAPRALSHSWAWPRVILVKFSGTTRFPAHSALSVALVVGAR